MELKFERKYKDSRKDFLLASYGDKKISLFEIKKGQTRGRTYMEKTNPADSTLVKNIGYRTINVGTNEEKILTLESPKELSES